MLNFLKQQIRTSPREALAAFVTFVTADADSKETPKTYQQRLGGFISYLEAEGVSHIGDVKPGHVDRYVAQLKAQEVLYANGNSDRPPEPGGLSKSTIAGRVQAIRYFDKWCVERYKLESRFSSHLRVRRPRARPRDKAMRYEELLRLLSYASNLATATRSPDALRYMAILAFTVDTMARRGEIASVQFPINLESPRAVAVKRGQRVITLTAYSANVIGKNGPRTVWFSEWAAHWMRKYRAIRPIPRHHTPHNYFWVALSDRHYGLPLTPGGLYQAHKAVVDAIELQGPSGLHAIRHCMASYWSHHTSLDKLQEKLGHADIVTTRAYVATDESEIIANTVELSLVRTTS